MRDKTAQIHTIRIASYCDIIRTAVNEWSLRVHFAQTLSAGNVLYQKHYTCTPASAGIVHLDATVQSTECHMTRFEPIRLQNILGSCIIGAIYTSFRQAYTADI